ncbi:methyl farnesoate epoxidase-like [Neocloeon triangulifer]|uniref:methyl farnesoate epoxidase-like n=1 Tax=Neocloeon triangulifer TaxID=2078957 RepID=UPI00286F74E7|nr:methyl farnesoate epoxidase-like [Neocloeon triangulifer]
MAAFVSISLIFLAIFFILRWLSSKPAKFPPGPPRWPIVGNLVELIRGAKGGAIHEIFMRLANKYGPILGLFMGTQPTIIISDYLAIRELGARDDLCGRTINKVGQIMQKGRKYGLIFNHGDDWREQRRFTLRHLKDLGFGKKSMECIIQEEAENLVTEVAKKAGANFQQPVELYNILGTASINVLWFIIAGQRYSHDDARLQKLITLIKDISSQFNAAGGLAACFPIILDIAPGLTEIEKFKLVRQRVKDFIMEDVNAHKETLDQENPRDFLDMYLIEIEKNKDKKDTSYYEEQLVFVVGDLFLAGVDTTFNAMAFTLVYMVCNPEVQKKVHDEIDAVVGRDRLPSLNDRSNMPYVEATIQESLRMSSVAPLAVPHAPLFAKFDTPFREFIFPKDSRILLNIAHVHMDPKLCGDPENFRPERFLTKNSKLIKPDYLLPFGSGKRQCLGETLAKNNLFLLFSALMQRYKLEVPEGCAPPNSREVEGAFTLGPVPYKAKVTPRFMA